MNAGLLIHIPHASVYMPPEYGGSYLLPPDELKKEIFWSADIYCDELYAADTGARLTACQSRLVCDVERFKDDALEIMARKGNGLYYTHTLRGKPLRANDPVLKEKIIKEIYDPHHKKLTALTDEILSVQGGCLIIDGHSFGDDPMHGDNLPDFCIGADAFHTPKALEDAAHTALRKLGYTTETNRPFAGAVTPFKHYQKDKRVMSVMLEINKRLYVKEDQVEKSENFTQVKNACEQVTQALVRALAAL